MKIFGFLLMLCCGWSLCQAETNGTQKSYIAAFMENYNISTSKFHLYLVTYDKAATVSVSVEQPSFHKMLSIGRNDFANVTLDSRYMLSGTELSSKSIVVKSDVDLSVFGFNWAPRSADASLILPVEDLDTEYFIFTPNTGLSHQFAVATGENAIEWVQVTVSGALTYKGTTYKNGDRITISLKPHQVIQLQSDTTLTGTRILASAPVAVFTGHKCYAAPSTTCDHLFEQLHPVKNWGTAFPVFPLVGHTNDVINIMAASKDTLVKVGQAPERTFNAGFYLDVTVAKTTLVTSSEPVLVSYLVQDKIPKGSDPFLMCVPPVQMTRTYYKFVTQKLYDNYITISSQALSPSGFLLDGQPLSHYNFSTKEIDELRSWEVPLGKVDGQHEISHKNSPFSIYVYGFVLSESYGYSMGQETTYPAAPKNLIEDLENQIGLKCFADRAEFRLLLSLVSEAKLNVSDFHLEDPDCKGAQEGEFMVINIPFNRCGSITQKEDGTPVYLNTVYGTVPTTGIHRMEIPLKCGLEKCKTIGFSLRPQVTDKASLGFCDVSLKVYKTKDFTDLVTTYPYQVELQSRLYIEFQLETKNKDLQLLVESCRASPSLEDKDNGYNVIHRGCPEDLTLMNHPVSDQRLQRFSFHVFKFKNFKEVYLSCDIIVCDSRTTPNRCTQGCLPKRQRRDVLSAEDYLKSAKLSQGPLVFVSDEQQTSGVSTPIFLAMVCIVGGLALIAVMGLVLQRRYYKRQAVQT